MKIQDVKIKNFKKLAFCEVNDLPDFVVLAGQNGAGKSSFIEAILLWKELIAGRNSTYLQQISPYNKVITKGERETTICIKVVFKPNDLEYLRRINFPIRNIDNIESVRVSVCIDSLNNVKIIMMGGNREDNEENFRILRQLLNYPDRRKYPFASIFDYFGPNRFMPPKVFNSFNPHVLSVQQEESTRITAPNQIEQKAHVLKDYLFALQQKEANWLIQKKKDAAKQGVIELLGAPDYFEDINRIISSVLPYLIFKEVKPGPFSDSPTEFLFELSDGTLVDLDELSSGEKAILCLFFEINRMEMHNSIVFIDEPEVHLNQSVEARIVPTILNEIVYKGSNQVFAVTHSTGILSAVSSENLFRIQSNKIGNQLTPIQTASDKLEVLKSIVGDLGVFTTADTYIFLEGKRHNQSLDKQVLEAFFPDLKGKVVFLSVGNSEVVKAISEKVSVILENDIPFGRFYAIRDRDRLSMDDVSQLEDKIKNFRVWPRCMLENFLLDPKAWSDVMNKSGTKKSPEEINQTFTNAARELKSEEIDLRLSDMLLGKLEMKDFRNHESYSTENKLTNLKSKIDGELSKITETISAISYQVDSEITDGTFIKYMHGKNLIKKAKCLLGFNMSEDYFIPLLANQIYNNGSVPEDLKTTLNVLIPELISE